MGNIVLRLQFNGPGEVADGAFVFALVIPGEPSVVMKSRFFRIHGNGFREIDDGRSYSSFSFQAAPRI